MTCTSTPLWWSKIVRRYVHQRFLLQQGLQLLCTSPPITDLLRPRTGTRKAQAIRTGVQRIDDPHHPRGYRELRSPSEMRKLMNRKITEQGGKCVLCQEPFTDYGDIVPDHRNPKGLGGAWRDDHPENIQAAHWWCNEEKGSTKDGGVNSKGLFPKKQQCQPHLSYALPKRPSHGPSQVRLG